MRVRLQGQRSHASVGWADGRAQTPQASVSPDEVSLVQDDVRYFLDGSLAGILRSLCARKVIGNLVFPQPDGSEKPDPDIFLVEPDWDGGFILASESAAKFCMDLSGQGFFVIAPVLLAYDTPFPQYIWRSRNVSPAKNTDDFAVLIPPHAGESARKLAFQKESGG
jgi:hypothetical protein